MFIIQAFKGENDWWRYILVTIVVGIGYWIGTIPLQLAVWRMVDSHPESSTLDIQQIMESMDFQYIGINNNLSLVLLLLTFIGAAAAFYFVFKPVHKREFRTLSRTASQIDWSRILFGFWLWMGMGLLFEGVNYFINPEGYSSGFRWNTFIPLLLISVLILPIQTSFEELFFRGYLMQALGTARVRSIVLAVVGILIAIVVSTILLPFIPVGHLAIGGFIQSMIGLTVMCLILFGIFKFFGTSDESKGLHNNKIIPLILTSVLFGLVHGGNPEVQKFGLGIMMTYYILAGLFLGILTLMDNRLELALGVHAATNITGAVFVGYEGAALQTDSVLKSIELNPLIMTIGFIVMALIFIIVAKKKYNWGSFSELMEPIYKPDENKALNDLLHEHLIQKETL